MREAHASVYIDKSDTISPIDSDSIEGLWSWKLLVHRQPVPYVPESASRGSPTLELRARISPRASGSGGAERSGTVTAFIPPHIGPRRANNNTRISNR